MSNFLPTLPPWPAGKPFPTGALSLFYDSATDKEYGVFLERLSLGGSAYRELLLTEAKALLRSDPPSVVPNTLYGITGRWNALDTDSTVYVQGVMSSAYHTLGIVYDAQGQGQLVKVDVAAGAFSSLEASANPNHSNSLLKAYRYLTRAEIAANGKFGEAFEDLDYSTACIQTQVKVEKYQPDPAKPTVYAQVLVAVYDGTAPPEHYVHVDGSFRAGDTTPAKFVPAESAEAKYGYVRRDTSPATIKDWRVGELSIWAISGADQFATAKQAGGPFPAFTGAEDAYWLPAAAPAKPVPSLLTSDNTWTGLNDYSAKGFKLPVGGFVDEAGHLFIRQVDVGQRHFTFGKYYSLAKDSLIQWKPDEYIGQDGNGDVGLGRAATGVLEVNTGTAGQLATLNVLDLFVSSVQNLALNTFSKLAAFVQNFAALLPAGATKLVDTSDARLADLARGFIDFQNEAEFYEEDVVANNGAIFGGRFTGPYAALITGVAIRFNKHTGYTDNLVINLPNPGYMYRYVLAFRIGPGVTGIGSVTLKGASGNVVHKLTGPNQTVIIRGEYGGFSVLLLSGAAATTVLVSGRFRGAWAATTSYLKNDTVLQGGLQYYALADFTSGAAFAASNWAAMPGGGVSAADLETVRTTVKQSAPITADYTLALADAGNLIQVQAAATVTVPANADVAFVRGTIISLVPTTAAMPTVAAASGVTVLAATGAGGAGQGLPLRLVQLEINSWLLTGGA